MRSTHRGGCLLGYFTVDTAEKKSEVAWKAIGDAEYATLIARWLLLLICFF